MLPAIVFLLCFFSSRACWPRLILVRISSDVDDGGDGPDWEVSLGGMGS